MGDRNRFEALEAELRQRDIDIRELKEELALVNSIAHYRLTVMQAQSKLLRIPAPSAEPKL